MSDAVRKGPLAGFKLVEFESIGPAPFAVMLLADLGVEVLRIERVGAHWPDVPIITRGRATMRLDLKQPEDCDAALAILASADAVVEGFRPGVMERLGLGPDVALKRNPRLIYGRMTGWGQEGPLASSAGHDVNYIGLTGMLAMLSRDGERPVAPHNLLGDYGGGSLYLAIGILAALLERERSGQGQVVDAAIVDGAVSMLAPIMGMIAANLLPKNPVEGMLAGGSPAYRTYACADGRFVAVGPLEPGFRRQLTDRLGLAPGALDDPAGAAAVEAVFASRTRDEWASFFEGSDCCVTPVLDLDEAPDHPQLAGRSSFIEADGLLQPAPAPRFSRTPGEVAKSDQPEAMLERWGVNLGSLANGG
jgi:alpha-methylacyl-CoA racemase